MRCWLVVACVVDAFVPSTSSHQRHVAVNGIFDGVKDAFSQDVSVLDDDRVTPFDRWLGIDVRSDELKQGDFAVPDDFVDSMDEANYVMVSLPKPMGIVFEENDPSCGGVFVASVAADGAAATDGAIMAGDQLIAVGDTQCKGLDFDTCLASIQASATDTTKLIFFRGGPSSLYGPLGCSQEWLDGFLTKHSSSSSSA